MMIIDSDDGFLLLTHGCGTKGLRGEVDREIFKNHDFYWEIHRGVLEVASIQSKHGRSSRGRYLHQITFKRDLIPKQAV